jgi:hypothetical protein
VLRVITCVFMNSDRNLLFSVLISLLYKAFLFKFVYSVLTGFNLPLIDLILL